MANGNGAPSPIYLTGQEPVIGQPQVVGAMVIATVKCPCGAHPVTLVSQFVGQQWQSTQMACALCQTPYSIAAVRMDAEGRLTFGLAVGVKPSLVG